MTPRLSGHFSIFGLAFFVLVSFGNCETMESWKIYNFDPKASESCSNCSIPNTGYSWQWRFSILQLNGLAFFYIINPLKSKMPSSATVTLQEVLLLYLRTQRIVVRISAFSCGRSQDTIHPPLQASSSIHSTAAISMACRSPVENKMIFLISYLFFTVKA